MEQRYDAIVVGGGHNGLVAAAYLAKQGHRTLVCEAREVVGGAAVTEQPFGPGYKVTSLSYVVSLMPQGSSATSTCTATATRSTPGPLLRPHARGTSLQLNDPARRREEIARFSPRDADAEERWDAWMAGLADVLGPLLSAVPPKVGSRHPVDLAEQARLVWRLRGLDTRKAADVTRLFTLSIADLLEEYFESPEPRPSTPSAASSAPGPRAPGTAYVMAHHTSATSATASWAAGALPRAAWAGSATPWPRPPAPSGPRSAPRPRSGASPPGTAGPPGSSWRAGRR